MQKVVHVDWYATVLRQEALAAEIVAAAPLALRYGAGLSCAEIGQVVGKTAVSVRVSMHRIIEELRRRYPYDE